MKRNTEIHVRSLMGGGVCFLFCLLPMRILQPDFSNIRVVQLLVYAFGWILVVAFCSILIARKTPIVILNVLGVICWIGTVWITIETGISLAQ